jgi:hypothetical protein
MGHPWNLDEMGEHVHYVYSKVFRKPFSIDIPLLSKAPKE